MARENGEVCFLLACITREVTMINKQKLWELPVCRGDKICRHAISYGAD